MENKGAICGYRLLHNLNYNELTEVVEQIESLIVSKFNELSNRNIQKISGYPSSLNNRHCEKIRAYLNEVEVMGIDGNGNEYVVLPKGNLGVLAPYKYSNLNDLRQTMIRKTT